jgi:hypothetical protein
VWKRMIFTDSPRFCTALMICRHVVFMDFSIFSPPLLFFFHFWATNQNARYEDGFFLHCCQVFLEKWKSPIFYTGCTFFRSSVFRQSDLLELFFSTFQKRKREKADLWLVRLVKCKLFSGFCIFCLKLKL